jgi:two-component system, chemotaxis family, sensor kinase CheA
MSSDFSEPQSEFLDDFYSECDELLGNFRTQLTLLDEACRNARTDSVALETLYRSAHSLKGISAMVGLREAEELAHAVEGLLRLLSRSETSLSSSRVDLLGRATQRLEQIVTAHRLRQSLPNGTDLIAQLDGNPGRAQDMAAISPSPSSPETSSARSAGDPPVAPAAGPAPLAQASASGALIWRASFSPSAELDARGINVNSVRRTGSMERR